MRASKNIPTGADTNHFGSSNAVTSPLLCRKDAARYLSVAYQTLAQWAVSGRYDLRQYKIGRKSMYRKSDLDAFIACNVNNSSQTTQRGVSHA